MKKSMQKELGSKCIISLLIMLAKFGSRFQNFRQIGPGVPEISRIQFFAQTDFRTCILDSRYLRNRWSDLRKILESGLDFCKDHKLRDDANRSEHFLHTFCTFANLQIQLYIMCSQKNQKSHLAKSFFLVKNRVSLNLRVSRSWIREVQHFKNPRKTEKCAKSVQKVL